MMVDCPHCHTGYDPHECASECPHPVNIQSDTIICVSSDHQRREHARRAEDVSYREKARQRDEMVTQSRIYFDIYTAEHRNAVIASAQPGIAAFERMRLTNDARRFAALGHEHAHNLKLAGINVVCRCTFCSTAGELVAEAPEQMEGEKKA